jgi:2-keto-4-pentenoate hydratase
VPDAVTGTQLPRAVAVEAAASRLRAAAIRGKPCAPVRDVLGRSDVALAYEVQRLITRRRLADGARVVGRKIGLTSAAVQQQLGVDQPDLGVLFDDMQVSNGAPVPVSRLLQPKAEAEVAFVLAGDLADGPLDEAQVRRAVHHAAGAVEIVDSRIRDWDITITDTIADNASGGMFVLGSEQLPLDAFEPAKVTMTLYRDGVAASTGSGRDCLGDPLTALAWLATTARELGAPLRGGDVVLSGALGPMVNITPGCSVTAQLSELGRVAVAFTQE